MDGETVPFVTKYLHEKFASMVDGDACLHLLNASLSTLLAVNLVST